MIHDKNLNKYGRYEGQNNCRVKMRFWFIYFLPCNEFICDIKNIEGYVNNIYGKF